MGLHAGEVTLCRLGTIQNKETTPIGDTVNVAARLEASSKELGWTVVASNHVLERAGDGVQTGGMTSLAVRGKNLYVDVAEITGLVTNMDDKVHGMATLTERAAEVRAAVQINSEITARAVKGALKSKLSAMKELSFGPDEEPLRLKGYRITRKIGAGGMTQVYLAVRESDGLPVVLKVLDASGQEAGAHLGQQAHPGPQLIAIIQGPHQHQQGRPGQTPSLRRGQGGAHPQAGQETGKDRQSAHPRHGLTMQTPPLPRVVHQAGPRRQAHQGGQDQGADEQGQGKRQEYVHQCHRS